MDFLIGALALTQDVPGKLQPLRFTLQARDFSIRNANFKDIFSQDSSTMEPWSMGQSILIPNLQLL